MRHCCKTSENHLSSPNPHILGEFPNSTSTQPSLQMKVLCVSFPSHAPEHAHGEISARVAKYVCGIGHEGCISCWIQLPEVSEAENIHPCKGHLPHAIGMLSPLYSFRVACAWNVQSQTLFQAAEESDANGFHFIKQHIPNVVVIYFSVNRLIRFT